MVHNTAKLGGPASNAVVGKVGVSYGSCYGSHNGLLHIYLLTTFTCLQHGLMMMIWKPIPTPDEDAFAAIKAGIDALPPGAKMLLNSGPWSFDRHCQSFQLTQPFQASSTDKAAPLRTSSLSLASSRSTQSTPIAHSSP